MAGASADSPSFWQIGINVNKNFEGRHIATGLVSMLKADILKKELFHIMGQVFQILHHSMSLRKLDLRLPGWN